MMSHHVAAHREFFEFFPHGNLRSDFHRMRRGTTGAGGINRSGLRDQSPAQMRGSRHEPAVTDATTYTLRQQTDISSVACRLLTRAPKQRHHSVIRLRGETAPPGDCGRTCSCPGGPRGGHLKLQGRGDTRGFRRARRTHERDASCCWGPTNAFILSE